MSDNIELRKKLYNLFDPDTCRDDLYVSLDEARGSQSVINELANTINLSDKPVYQLLAGHRGSGKSTELIRLKDKLKTGEDKYFVVSFDIVGERDIDPRDVEFSEVLIAIISHLANDIKEAFNEELADTYFKQLFKGINDTLKKTVDFSSIELSAGFVKLSAALSTNPDLRKKLRGKMASIANQWIDAANAYIDAASDLVIKNGYEGLVIIVDGLDKLITSLDPEQKSCAEKLFDDWGNQLRSLNCHMLYTIPIDLAYSVSERNIASSFGTTSPPVVPMTKLFDDDDNKTVGFDLFIEIVEKRIEEAGGSIDDVFDKDQDALRELIKKSGGQPRELMVLIRAAMVSGDLPIDSKDISIASGDITNPYRRQLYKEHWQEIEFVRENHRFNLSMENDRICMDLLGMRAVLQYRNGKEWYGLNPLLPENPYTKRKGKDKGKK